MCENRLEKGLYVAYMKVQSNLEFAKIMIPFNMPNSLPFQKVRDNPFVSKYFLTVLEIYLSILIKFKNE
jgi:hypothetical protein